MKYYYGFSNQYDRPAVNSDGERLGDVMIFTSKKTRDQWINEDAGFQREYISSDEAMSFMKHAISGWYPYIRTMDMPYHPDLSKVSNIISWYRLVCMDEGFEPILSSHDLIKCLSSRDPVR